MKKLLGRTAIVLLLILMLILSTIGTASAETGSQTWVLLPLTLQDLQDMELLSKAPDLPEGMSLNSIYPMVKLSDALEFLGTTELSLMEIIQTAAMIIDSALPIDIESGDCVYWVSMGIDADSGEFGPLPAQSDVTFPSGSWQLDFVSQSGWANECTVNLGSTDDSGFDVFATYPGNEGSLPIGVVDYDMVLISEVEVIDLTDLDSTVPFGDYLAIQICNDDGVSHDFVLGKLISPISDPGFPTPELPTILLISLGLLGLGGYFIIKRRRTRTAAIT